MKLQVQLKEKYIFVDDYNHLKNDDLTLTIKYNKSSIIYKRDSMSKNNLFIFNDYYINSLLSYQESCFIIKHSNKISREFLIIISKTLRYVFDEEIEVKTINNNLCIKCEENNENLKKIAFAYFIANILEYEDYRKILVIIEQKVIEEYMLGFVRKESIFKHCNYVCYTIFITEKIVDETCEDKLNIGNLLYPINL